MDNAIGFRRNIYLGWLDAAAVYAAAGDDDAALRAHLDPLIAQTVASAENRRYAITILTTIWLETGRHFPQLHTVALTLYAAAASPPDRLWLHYGMTMAAYPFFHQVVRVIGRRLLTKDTFTNADIRNAMIADRGHLGGMETAVDRVLFSLRNWGILTTGGRRGVHAAANPRLSTGNLDLQAWLLATALTAHSGEELPFLDLIRLPELFPFSFTLSLDHLRRHPWFAVQRQGAGLDMVRLAD